MDACTCNTFAAAGRCMSKAPSKTVLQRQIARQKLPIAAPNALAVGHSHATLALCSWNEPTHLQSMVWQEILPCLPCPAGRIDICIALPEVIEPILPCNQDSHLNGLMQQVASTCSKAQHKAIFLQANGALERTTLLAA